MYWEVQLLAALPTVPRYAFRNADCAWDNAFETGSSALLKRVYVLPSN